MKTVCFGIAASQGALILAGGEKGMRFAMPNARIMIHQPQGGCGVWALAFPKCDFIANCCDVYMYVYLPNRNYISIYIDVCICLGMCMHIYISILHEPLNAVSITCFDNIIYPLCRNIEDNQRGCTQNVC